MTDVLLHATGLSAGYGDLPVLRDIAVQVDRGRVTVVLGSNGAGKSTLLLTLAGLLRATSGVIALDGADITHVAAHMRTRRGLALVQENKRVFRRRTVEDNLRLGGYTMDKGSVRAAIERAYEMFPILADKRRQLAAGLSGGQQQMLAIAQALMPGPKILMLDEPSAGLAPVIVDDVLRVVDDLRQQGLGVLLVEQLVDRALTVADRVVLLERGLVVANGSSNMTNPEIRAAYFGELIEPK